MGVVVGGQIGRLFQIGVYARVYRLHSLGARFALSSGRRLTGYLAGL